MSFEIKPESVMGGLRVVDTELNESVLVVWRDYIPALREFFLAERDAELGRWRDPEAPDWVVGVRHDNPKQVGVYNERTHDYWISTREAADKYGELIEAHAVARRYFAAHPEPKPWHEATERQAWVITVDGEEIICRSDSDGDFHPLFHPVLATVPNRSSNITAARRIWPEEVSGE